VPVATIAGEARGLDREYGTDAPFADSGQQPLEAGTSDSPARSAQIVIYDLDTAPSELLGTLGKPVLTSLARVIVRQLIWR